MLNGLLIKIDDTHTHNACARVRTHAHDTHTCTLEKNRIQTHTNTHGGRFDRYL